MALLRCLLRLARTLAQLCHDHRDPTPGLPSSSDVVPQGLAAAASRE